MINLKKKKRFIFNSLPSCSIINFCYYKSRWWLKCFNQQWGNHRAPCLLSVSESCFESQPDEWKSRLLDSPKCSNHCDWGHWHEARRHSLFSARVSLSVGQCTPDCLSWWRVMGNRWRGLVIGSDTQVTHEEGHEAGDASQCFLSE